MPALEQTEFFVRESSGVQLGGIFHLRTTRRAQRQIFWERGELPGPVAVRFLLTADAETSQADRAVSRLVDDSGPLKRALANERLGFFGMLAALGLALLLGSVHALAPGHGKALVAAYLVGSKGKMRHAAILGLIVTFTHVFSVVALGLVALWAAEKVLPERLAPWLALASGLLVCGLGVWMLVSRIRKRGHDHHHEHGAGEVKWSELLLLGMSGGMVPCVSATVVLLFAVYVGRIVFGLMLIAAFSLGLALTLIVLGILVVRGRMLLGRLTSGRVIRMLKLLPVASAAVVAGLGVVMVVLAVPGL
jgi:ABC-type nickel/cobalt efflux system permease component RcnA